MKPKPSSPAASKRLQVTRQNDTSAEAAIRAQLRRLGVRFRVNTYADISVKTKPDIILRDHKVAVFVDGCFWHGCPKHATWPRANRQWWRAKIEGNIRRDLRNRARLRRVGWAVLRAWEHENAETAVKRILKTVRSINEREHGKVNP